MMNSIFLFIGSMGGWEVFLILFAILILFGAKKIPELARGFGQGIREFKDATKEIKSNLDEGMNQPQAPRAGNAPAPRAPQAPNTTDHTNTPNT